MESPSDLSERGPDCRPVRLLVERAAHGAFVDGSRAPRRAAQRNGWAIRLGRSSRGPQRETTTDNRRGHEKRADRGRRRPALGSVAEGGYYLERTLLDGVSPDMRSRRKGSSDRARDHGGGESKRPPRSHRVSMASWPASRRRYNKRGARLGIRRASIHHTTAGWRRGKLPFASTRRAATGVKKTRSLASYRQVKKCASSSPEGFRRGD